MIDGPLPKTSHASQWIVNFVSNMMTMFSMVSISPHESSPDEIRV